MPTTQSTKMSTDAKIGRRTQSAASHCIAGLLDARAVANVGAWVKDDVFARFHPAHHRYVFPQWFAELHEALLHQLVGTHHEDAGLGVVARDRRRRNHRTCLLP